MTDRKDGIRIPARAAIAVALAAVLAACSAHNSTSSTDSVSPSANVSPAANVSAAANVSPMAGVSDPPVRESELPEIVVSARALHPGQASNETMPSYTGKRQAMARKARVPSNASNESG